MVAVARVRTGGEDAGVRQETRGIPLSSPFLDERDEELVLDVLRSGRLSLGPTIDRFEELFAAAVGAPYAAAVSCGTAGLHLLCISAGIAGGDEVITSPYSFAASANCFIYEGGVPVFADVDPRTLNMDPAAVEDAVTSRTKAIVAVDIYGYPCELDELRAIAERHGLALIDDSCEALGATYRGARLGSHGPPAIDDVRSALGIGQLEKLDEILRLRAEVAGRYAEILDGIDGVELPVADDADHVRSWFVYVVALPDNAARERVIAQFEREGIGYNRYLPSIHLQPYMRERYGFGEGLCPVAEDYSSRTLALPFFTALERGAQERVAEALAAAL